MRLKGPTLIINTLVLVGRRKDYVVPFSRGVNIIYGDSATGKSSVLECINYLLGASKFVFDTEIESSVRYVMMEVVLNEHTYVIRRDIFLPNEAIEVFLSNLGSIGQHYPRKFAPNFSLQPGADGYFSDFMLDALGLPKIKLRQSASRPDSDMIRLSFRDVFKFSYLKQDSVGSKSLLDAGNYVLEAKNKQTFKYIFNLLDTSIADTQEELAGLITRTKRLATKYETISEFLRETEFDSEQNLTDAEQLIAAQRSGISEQLAWINSKMVADNEQYHYLKGELEKFTSMISLLDGDKASSERTADRYIRLKHDYHGDIEKLRAIRTARSVIGEPTESFSCPLCDSTVPLEDIRSRYAIAESDRANQEVNVLIKRVREVEVLIQAERDKQSRLASSLKMYVADRDKARQLLDEGAVQMITPYLSQRDGLSSELAKLDERRAQIAHAIKIRNQQKSILAEVKLLEDSIETLQGKLKSLQANAPSLAAVLGEMADILSAYLRFVKIKEPRGIAIGKTTYLPVLRDRDYRDITSGGLRTILSIGHYLSLIEMCLITQPSTQPTPNLPAFLMIDTVGKYLGKTSDRYQETSAVEDQKEEVSDPGKYLNMYEYMFNLAARAEQRDVACQIILVDNDVPPLVRLRHADAIRAHFNSEGLDGLSRGLIDDAHLIKS